MGCLLSKLFGKELENPEINPYNHLFESDRGPFVNPIYYNDCCKDENGIIYV